MLGELLEFGAFVLVFVFGYAIGWLSRDVSGG